MGLGLVCVRDDSSIFAAVTGQMWAAGSSKDGMKSSGITVESSQYWKPCNKEKRPTWSPEGSSGFEKANIEEASFKPRKPPAASMRMCWERDSE